MVLRTPVVEYGRTVVKPRTHSHRPQPCTHDSSATTRAARRHSRWLLAPAGAASACELPCPMRDSSSLMQLAGSCRRGSDCSRAQRTVLRRRMHLHRIVYQDATSQGRQRTRSLTRSRFMGRISHLPLFQRRSHPIVPMTASSAPTAPDSASCSSATLNSVFLSFVCAP